MKKITTLLAPIALAIITPFMVATFVAHPLSAASPAESICLGSGGTWATDSKAPSGGICSSSDKRTVVGTIQNVGDVLIYMVGAISLLMVIVGGVRYVVSAGDQSALTGAKNTIMYALIGLIISFTAYAIVHFVITAFKIT